MSTSSVNQRKTSITKDELQSLIPSAWREILAQELKMPYWDNIVDELNKAKLDITPPIDEVFNAFRLKPTDVKVILIGQDPYPKKGEAHGYSFSIRETVRNIPPSLKNIVKELNAEYGTSVVLANGNLERWEDDGVMLLNTILTTVPNASLAHEKIGWKEFTRAILGYFASRTDNVLFLLLGQQAKKAMEGINIIDRSRLIYAGHPSPRNVSGSFLGSDCFKAVNAQLLSRDILPIRWVSLLHAKDVK